MSDQELSKILKINRERFESALENRDVDALTVIVKELPVADLGIFLTTLNDSQLQDFAEMCKPFLPLEVLLHVGEHQKTLLIRALDVPGRLTEVQEWETDDLVEIMDVMSWEEKNQVLAVVSPQDRELLQVMSLYPEDTVARLVSTCDVVALAIWRVEEVVQHIQKMQGLSNDWHYIPVVGLNNKMVGMTTVCALLRADPKEIVQNIVQEVRSIPATASHQDLLYICRHYGLISVPVEDSEGRLMGVIHASTILEASEEEADESLLRLAGVREFDDAAPLRMQAGKRLAWLLVVVVNALMSAVVIERFHSVFEHRGVLAALMTLVSSIGAASGTQVLTVSVRGLALKVFQIRGIQSVVMRECFINLVTALCVGAGLCAAVYFWLGDLSLAILVFVSLLFQMLFSALGGVLIPWAVHRMGFDPTIGAAPLVMAVSDIIGFALFLWLSTFFIGM